MTNTDHDMPAIVPTALEPDGNRAPRDIVAAARDKISDDMQARWAQHARQRVAAYVLSLGVVDQDVADTFADRMVVAVAEITDPARGSAGRSFAEQNRLTLAVRMADETVGAYLQQVADELNAKHADTLKGPLTRGMLAGRLVDIWRDQPQVFLDVQATIDALDWRVQPVDVACPTPMPGSMPIQVVGPMPSVLTSAFWERARVNCKRLGLACIALVLGLGR